MQALLQSLEGGLLQQQLVGGRFENCAGRLDSRPLDGGLSDGRHVIHRLVVQRRGGSLR